jgi:hypothetical protein
MECPGGWAVCAITCCVLCCDERNFLCLATVMKNEE